MRYRSMKKGRRDPSYDSQEILKFESEVRATERLPLSVRKKNAAEFLMAMANDPALVSERVGWLIRGDYGYGSYLVAKRVLARRMNRVSWLSQTIAALEWSVPPRMAATAWKALSRSQQKILEDYILKAIQWARS